ncbi:MAG: hypothetical protein QXP02_04455 [Desulfurococcaceae archaeon]
MAINQAHGSMIYFLCENHDYCSLLRKIFKQIGLEQYIEFNNRLKIDLTGSKIIFAYVTATKSQAMLQYFKERCPEKLIIFTGYGIWRNIYELGDLVEIAKKCNPVIITHTTKDYNAVKNLLSDVRILDIPIHLLTASGIRDPLPHEGCILAHIDDCECLAMILDLLSKIGVYTPVINISASNCNHPLIINVNTDDFYPLISSSTLGLISMNDTLGFEIEGYLLWDSRPSITCGELASDLEYDENPLISKIKRCDPEMISEEILRIINSLMSYKKLGTDITTIWNFKGILKNILNELIT